MAPANRCNRDRLLKSLQDGLSIYFQSKANPKSMQRMSRRQNRLIANTHKITNVGLAKNIKIKNKSVSGSIINNKKSSYKKQSELRKLNDGLTQFYESSESKRRSLYRSLSKDNIQADEKAHNKTKNKKVSNMATANIIKDEENQALKIRKSQLQVLMDGLSGYFSTDDPFRRTACHYSTLKKISTPNTSSSHANTSHRTPTVRQGKDAQVSSCSGTQRDSHADTLINSAVQMVSATGAPRETGKRRKKGGRHEDAAKRSEKHTRKKETGAGRKKEDEEGSGMRKEAVRERGPLKRARFDQLLDGLSGYFKTDCKSRTRSTRWLGERREDGGEEKEDGGEEKEDGWKEKEDEGKKDREDAIEDGSNSTEDDSKCHQLLGLFDGLSHLYCPGNSRLRKSQNFYREGGLYRRKHAGNNAALAARNVPDEKMIIKRRKVGGDGLVEAAVKEGLGEERKGGKKKRNKSAKEKKAAKPVLKRPHKPTNPLKKHLKIKRAVGQRGGMDQSGRLKCFDFFPQLNSLDKLLFKRASKQAFRLLSKATDIPSNRCNSNYPLFIELGQYDVATWFPSFYPGHFSLCPKLYICEHCLKSMQSQETLLSHLSKCIQTHPPGKQIYRHASLSLWQVDGDVSRDYCRNLCLLAKLFLQHKTLYLDVEPFLFYVLALHDSRGSHLVGYFSKEKFCPQRFNLSCLMVLPQFQRQGYGRLLIHFSYLLTKKEGSFGSPEKPLSELGRLTYMRYWKSVLVQLLYHHSHRPLSLRDISMQTGMSGPDIVSTLEALNVIATLDHNFVLVLDRGKLKAMYDEVQKRNLLQLSEEHLSAKPLPF